MYCSGHSGEEVKLTDRRVTPLEIDKPKHVKKEGESSSSDSETSDNEPEQAFVSTVISTKEPNFDKSESEQKNGHNTEPNESAARVDINQNVSETTEILNTCNINDNKRTVDCQGHDCSQASKDLKVNSTEKALCTGSSIVDVAGVTQRAVSRSGAEHLRRLISKSKSSQTAGQDNILPMEAKESMLDILKQTLNEWKSEETLTYLFGTSYVIEPPGNKEEVPIANDQGEELDEDDLSFEATEDAKTSHFNESLPFQNDNNVSKPLPDFAKLKEETKIMELRVQEFFKGQYVLPEEVKSGQVEKDQSTSKKVSVQYSSGFPPFEA